MRRRNNNLIALILLVLTAWTTTLYAGDEDMSPSAYHVFDPETGYMITVDPEAEAQALGTNDSVAPEVDATTPVPWQVWVAAIVIAGGIFVWRSKRRASRN